MLHKIKKVFELEAATGILLFVATLAALLLVNFGGGSWYQELFELRMDLQLGNLTKAMNLQAWINDALMALFFLLIGLELKEEVFAGELSSKEKALLPLIAALGGMIIPATIFYFFNQHHQENLRGFAISTATDIAFAYGVICLFGSRISKSLKVFLISLAIFDDLLAILIIAIFYTHNFSWFYFYAAVFMTMILAALNFFRCRQIIFYLLLGIILWLAVLKSGIHPTLAGVVLAIFIPREKNLLHNLIKQIAPLVNFVILPIFAFANSGVVLKNFSTDIFTSPLFLGIALGLFFGKQIGVMLFSLVAIKLGWVNLPTVKKSIKNSLQKKSAAHSNLQNRKIAWLQFYGVSIITGIGFTMSFFIGNLAFVNNPHFFDEVKIAVLTGSLLSALWGIAVLAIAVKK